MSVRCPRASACRTCSSSLRDHAAPITIKTGDPLKGWSAGLVWVFFQSFVLMIGGFIAPYIRKITPRAALLGALAGISITFISMRPALEMFMTPVIGLLCFSLRDPGQLAGAATNINQGQFRRAWCAIAGRDADRMGLDRGWRWLWRDERCESHGRFRDLRLLGAAAGLRHGVFSGFEFLGVILVTAIPFGIYDLVD